MKFDVQPGGTADFQPHIFWAYGLACAFLFLFTLWTLSQTVRTRRRLEYLEERFRKAYPGSDGSPAR